MRTRGQFNFAWIFALIIGGSILVLAIYGAVSAGNTQRGITDTKNARSLSIITDPLQAGFSDSNYNIIEFSDVTRLENRCYTDGFGENEISVATRSDVLEEWTTAGIPASIENKYIFSENNLEAELVYAYSKPFNFPYKVSDLIFLTSDEYCFVNAPENIIDDVENVGNINTTDCKEDESYVTVCFGSGSRCEINVIGSCRSSSCESVYDEGIVSKPGFQVKYIGSLMYGAIYSSEEVYTCNVDRLLYRTGKIAEVLAEKAKLMNLRSCNTNLGSAVEVYGDGVINSSFEDLLFIDSRELERRNEREVCGLWA